jgi:hypothetical protein
MEAGGQSNKVVHICTGSIGAVQEPGFLIEHNGKFYITLAVQEFDPDIMLKEGDERKSMIYRDMKNLMDQGLPLRSAPMPDGWGIKYANTFANTDASSQLGGGGEGGEDDDPND